MHAIEEIERHPIGAMIAGLPQPIITLINRHIASIARSPVCREMIDNGGLIPVSSAPEELGMIVIETRVQTARTNREFGLGID